MNEAIATNIRLFRDHRSWTQEHLAEAAGVTTRTIQRAEGGHPMTAETLTAIAGAFDVSLEVLRLDLIATMAAQFGVAREDLTPELIERRLAEQQKEIDAKYIKIAVRRATSAAMFRELAGAYAFTLEVVSGDEEAQDVAAELQAHIQDYVDVAGDIGPVGQREMEKQAYEMVERLEALGCVVCVGAGGHPIKFADGSKATWPMAYVVVSTAADEKSWVGIERGSQLRFQ